jgi:hypothetical protein
MLNVLKKLVGYENVRVENNKIYVFSSKNNTFIYFASLVTIETFSYNELQTSLEKYGY